MRATQYPSKRLLPLFHKQKIATLSELKATLGSKCTMTVFRKLSELTYLTSCSHGGSYYSLKRIARFDHRGLWFFDSVVFSSVGTLAATLTRLVERSDEGLSAKEIHELLGINPNAALLALLSQKKITREKILGVFVYFSLANATRKKQELHRKGSVDRIDAIRLVPEILLNELKAAIILFYSTLDEQQRRLYAGLESWCTSKRLLPLFHKQKIATLSELKATLGSKCTMTVFRKLSELTYLTSCSHGGSYYSLKRIARFDHRGLWFFDSVVFSSVGTLAATLTRLVERSDEGLSAKEIHELLGINPNAALLALLSQKAAFGLYHYEGNPVSFETPATTVP